MSVVMVSRGDRQAHGVSLTTIPVERPRVRRPSAHRRPPMPAAAGQRLVPRVHACGITRPRRKSARWPSLVGLAFAVFSCVFGLGVLANAMAESAVPAEVTTVTVGTGETLWDVARRVAPDSDPGAIVDRIGELNGPLSPPLAPGLPLTVPTGD